MRDIAKSHGGICLSKSYLGMHRKLTWRCSEGHVWQSSPHSVKGARSWCSECAGLKKKTLSDVQAAAEKKGGNVYRRNMSMLKAKF